MAYAFFEQNVGFLQKIAEDDTHKAYIEHSHPLSVVKTISTAEFEKVKYGLQKPTLDIASGNISWGYDGIDGDAAVEGTDNEQLGYSAEDQITGDIAGMIGVIDQSINEFPDSGMVPALNTYKAALQGFDTSSVSLPTTGIFARTLESAGVSPVYVALQIA